MTYATRTNWIRRTAAGLATALLAATAVAQDYTVTTATGKLETRPAGATQITSVSTAVTSSHTIVDLPFEFPYYGRVFTKLHIDVNGFVIPGTKGAIVNAPFPYANHGWDLTTGAFPYSDQGKVNTGEPAQVDGLIAPLWTQYLCINTSGCAGGGGSMYTWTGGTPSDPRFVISWERVFLGNATATATVQVHLYASGQVVFAYDPSGDYSKPQYVCGLDSYGDSRFVAPMANSRTITGKPTSDFVFTPRAATLSGRLQYDKIVSDSTGIGNSVSADEDLGGLDVELTRDGGILAATGRTAPDGTYSLRAVGTASSSTGTLRLLAGNSAVRVMTSQGSPTIEWTFASDIDLSADASLGTANLDEDNDSGATLRSAFNVAVQCGRALGWVAERSSTAVAQIDVYLDDTLSRATYFQPGTAGAPSILSVAGKASPSPDAWDDAVVVHAYAREIFGALAAHPPTNADHRFDAATTAQNAFAEAFGYAIWRAVSGSSEVVDGTSATAATVHDLEDPTLTNVGPTVAGAVAAGLHDAIDAANETSDVLDGTGVEDRLLAVVDASTVAPNVESFVQGWVDAGHDGVALTRALIGAGALIDDADEPNDADDETTALGSVGALRPARVLQRLNEDWYTVTLPEAVTAFRADVAWDRSSIGATIALEVRNAAGTLVASGAPVGTTGPYRAVTGALPAGTYRIAVRHLSGVSITSYAVQAYELLQVAQTPFRNWTVGSAYSQSFGISGGVPPYTVATPGSAPPPGLSLSTAQLGAVGEPTTAGKFSVTLEVRDSGSPQNVSSVTQTVTIAAAVDVELQRFLGFPHGVPVDAALRVSGGTAPLSHELSQGTLPDGLSFDEASFRVTGTATTIGSSQVRFAARDAAGSTDSVLTQALVCPAGAPKGLVLDLAAGEAACGFYVDAVRGSTFNFSVKPVKGAVPRTLEVTVLGPDRDVIVGGKVKLKPGKAIGSKIPCEHSGRYYVILSSLSGEASQLVAGTSTSVPRKVKGVVGTVTPGSLQTISIGALPGSKLVVKAAAPRRGKLVARCAGLVDPEGTTVDLDGLVVESSRGFTLKADLPIGGTWRVLVVGTPADAPPAAVSFTASVKAPKGAAYVAE